MMHRRIRKMGVILTLCAAMLAGSSTSAFAQMDDTEDSGATIEESLSHTATAQERTETGGTLQDTSSTGTDRSDGDGTKETAQGQQETSSGIGSEDSEESGSQKSKGTPQILSPSVGAASTASLTPSGNMDLVDDLDEETGKDMQFMTVKSRDGSYFYIVIDRAGSSENVYFLNEVDASDLMSLMSDEEKAKVIAQETETEEAKEDSLFSISSPTVESGEEMESAPAETNDVQGEIATEEEEKEEAKTGSQIPILIFVGILAALIIGGYYMLKIRPQKGANFGDDLEFEDDEEYEQEEIGRDEEEDDLF